MTCGCAGVDGGSHVVEIETLIVRGERPRVTGNVRIRECELGEPCDMGKVTGDPPAIASADTARTRRFLVQRQ
jgi:hypothetical protein